MLPLAEEVALVAAQLLLAGEGHRGVPEPADCRAVPLVVLPVLHGWFTPVDTAAYRNAKLQRRHVDGMQWLHSSAPASPTRRKGVWR